MAAECPPADSVLARQESSSDRVPVATAKAPSDAHASIPVSSASSAQDSPLQAAVTEELPVPRAEGELPGSSVPTAPVTDASGSEAVVFMQSSAAATGAPSDAQVSVPVSLASSTHASFPPFPAAVVVAVAEDHRA